MNFNYLRYVSIAAIALVLVMGINTNTALAQQTGSWYDLPVTTAKLAQINKSIARPARDDYSIVVWEDYRSGYAEIYAQKIDGYTGLPLWSPANGVKVATGTDQYNPKATYDAVGGVYVVWEQEYGGTTEIWSQRLLLTDGSIDSRWLPSGHYLSFLDGAESSGPEIIGNEYGFYCVWTDMRYNVDVMITMYFENATTMAGYPTTINATDMEERNPVITTDGDPINQYYGVMMGAYVAYESNESGNFEIMATHFDIYNGIGMSEVVSDMAGNECRNPIITETGPIPADTQGGWDPMGAVVVWEEQGNNGWEIMARNYDITGYGGRPNGVQYQQAVVLCDEQNDQTYPVADCIGMGEDADVRVDGGGYYPTHWCYVAWEDLRGADVDIYISYFDVYSGTILTQTPQGEMVTTAASDQVHPDLEVQNYRAVGVCWQGADNGMDQVFFQEFDLSLLSYAGPTDGWLVANISGGQTKPFIGKGILTFDDMRNQNEDVYTQKLKSYTGVAVSTYLNAIWLGGYYTPLTTRTILSKDAVMDDDGCTYLTWSVGNYNDSSMVYVQKISEHGKKMWNVDGVLLGKFNSSNLNPVVCTGNTGSAYVSWSTFDGTGTDSIYVAYIRNDGEVTMRKAVCDGSLPDIDRDDDLSGGAYIASTFATFVEVHEVDNTGTITAYPIPYPQLRCYLYGPKIARKNMDAFYVVAAHDPADYELAYWTPNDIVKPISKLYGDYGFDAEGDDGGGGLNILARSKDDQGNWYVNYGTTNGIFDPPVMQIAAGQVASGFVIDALSSQSYGTWNVYDGSDYTLMCDKISDDQIDPFVVTTSIDPIFADLAYMDGLVYVVWEDLSSGFTTIRSQAYTFTQNPPLPLWTTSEDVRPLGSVISYQTRPIIANNNAQWNPPAVFMNERFWLQSQWNNLISGVRFYNASNIYGQNTIAWYKRNRKGADVPAVCELGTPYPNPYSLNSGGALNIPVQSGGDAIQSVRVYNMLGQEVFAIPNAMQGEGEFIAVSPSALQQYLKPGMYMVVAHTGAGLISKSITVTH